MKLPFLDRDPELSRLQRLLAAPEGALGVLYGRRRCGKSRLLRQALSGFPAAYYVGDDRDATLQRSSLATEISRLLPRFEQVTYPDWEALLARFWAEAKPGTALALDEFPALVATAPELPSVLQRYVDHHSERRIHLLLSGSSQRMMQGLVLDRTAPLFGRAREILKISPLPSGWIERALPLGSAAAAVEAHSVWGGIPRYWELAADHGELSAAVEALVLDPLAVLHDEPARLLLDDLRDTTQAASILSLIGQGRHRASEIAGRLGKPATSLSRPLARLQEMELVDRETPFGEPPRSTKRALYKIRDPFLRFWFRFVEPNRSRLGAGQMAAVRRDLAARFPHHVGQEWEDLARESVPRLGCFGKSWGPASRWWGPGLDRKPLEVDLVAEDEAGEALLVGEAKWSEPADAAKILAALAAKVSRLPLAEGKQVFLALWLKAPAPGKLGRQVFHPRQVLAVLR